MLAKLAEDAPLLTGLQPELEVADAGLRDVRLGPEVARVGPRLVDSFTATDRG